MNFISGPAKLAFVENRKLLTGLLAGPSTSSAPISGVSRTGPPLVLCLLTLLYKYQPSAASRWVKCALISVVSTVFVSICEIFFLTLVTLTCVSSPSPPKPICPSLSRWMMVSECVQPVCVFWQYLWGLMWTRMSPACCYYLHLFVFFFGGGVECLVAPLKICLSWPAFNKLCQLEWTYKLMGMDRKTRKSTWINGNQGYKRIKALTIKGYFWACCTCDKETMNTSYASWQINIRK